MDPQQDEWRSRYLTAMFDIYARQEFKTPGAWLTLDLASQTCTLGPGSLVLDIAAGKGEAACVLAERHGCRVLAVDLHRSALRFAAAKARHRRQRRLVAAAWADGRRLPVPDDRFDLALCIGAPSIVGIPDCWREMRRAVRPGGWLVMSDAVLIADLPPDRAGRPDWAAALLPFDGYRRGIEDAGLEVVAADLMPPAVWDEYYAPMRGLLEEVRRYRRDPDALAWADENEAMIRQEQALLPVMAYAHFAARRPE